MAAVILAAGEKGARTATPNAEIMIHQVGGGVAGKTADIQIQAERITRMQNSMVTMLADWTGKKKSCIREDMERDCFMSAEEAREYGIIDEVLEPYRQ
jgi:ATP-dependent Clp protease protease subunit